ncbi:MAG: family 20 glycosylhydrolase [Saprospiraceae bacterium]|nr:family 20 glycosylhydrolase [Saprospiraceae bacterium]
MRLPSFILAFFALALCLPLFAQTPALIPQPVSVQPLKGSFRLNAQTTIGYSQAAAKPAAEYLATRLKTPTGYRLPIQRQGQIQIRLNTKANPALGAEGYSLEVTPQGVRLSANAAAGLFYGVQTLLQLFPPEIESTTKVKRATWTAPALRITDYPRFAWRGVMLDVSRHFFSKDDVKRYIDRMARYKYNVFHWHLTDDQGWRIEIKSFPKLTQVGGCRVPRYGKYGYHVAPKPGEPATDCGFYTQDDIRDIVAYAAERHITVLPEIDVPGHSMAAIAAYPELSCTKDTSTRVNPGSRFVEWYGNGKFKMLIENSLNPADEQVYQFLDKVFGELATLFPSTYIHVGGDECYHGFWENDPGCQALMQREGLQNTHELQSYFLKRVEKILQAKGKKMIGWDEILEGGLAPEAAVMSWRGLEGGIQAAKLGHPVVMTPNDYVYIDLLQGDPLVEPDQTAYKRVRLQKTYTFEPVPDSVDARWILGGEANLWTEKVYSIRQAEYMSFPRAWATADIYWSPKSAKNWDNFTQRMEQHFQRADAAGCNYARSAYDAIVTAIRQDGKLLAEVTTEIKGLDVFYTLDESLPDRYSPRYTQPVEIPEGPVTMKVITYRNGQPLGKMIALPREELIRRVK